ncbi:MAG TPA: hypothetical protein VKZ44_09160 [Taishania sp.]|nr:hypothetical protein [Taishania sp.]
MNLRNWTTEQTKGLLIGIVIILVSALIVIGILGLQSSTPYDLNFKRFIHLHGFTAKVLSLSAIGILPFFHFVALKRGKWAFGQGLIMATVLDLLAVLLFKFIL